MTKQRKINSTYAIVMVIGLAFMLLFGYLVKPFSTVTVTGVKMLGVLIGLIIITCFNGDLLSGSLMALLATLFHGYYDISLPPMSLQPLLVALPSTFCSSDW